MKRSLSFVAGLLTGVVLFGGSVAYAAGIMAEYAPQTAYVNGAPVQLDAYNINGYNYVKLRDIGQAVGFNVYWDGQSVQMDRDAPYTGTGPVQIVESLQIGSFNGSTLKAGTRSTLIISPYGTEFTPTSSNPSVVSLEQVRGYWVAVANAPGTATITARTADGRVGTVTITVEGSAQAGIDLSANMEIRLEIIRLTNQVRKEHGLSELPINESLMNAAQDISSRKYTEHHTQEECETIIAYGYPHGAGTNLTVFSGTSPQYIAQTAVSNWVNSPGHLQAILYPARDCIGVGVTLEGGRAYCQMYIGSSQTHNPYEKN